MGKVISVVNQKGGTGKTTTTVNLAAALAEIGKFVLLIDFDPQGNASSGLGVEVSQTDATIYDAIVGNVSMRDVVRRAGKKRGFDIIPANQNLSGASVELVNEKEREFKFRKGLSEIRNDYDYILIDCPPSLGLLTINSLVASEKVLIPVQCEYYALEGLGQLVNTISLIKNNLQSDLEIMGVLLTMFDKRVNLAKDVVAEVKKNFPSRVFQIVIPRNVRLAEAPSFGESVLERASWSKGAKAYRKLAREVININ